MIDKYLKESKTNDLLILYAKLLDELKSRNVIRTYNSPVGDFAEWVASNRLRLTLVMNSTKGYDAYDKDGYRYQIKSRWLKEEKDSRQLNVIRNLENNDFDFLIGLLFNEKFEVIEAYKIPHGIIKTYGSYRKHVNGFVLQLKGDILADSKTEDITKLFR